MLLWFNILWFTYNDPPPLPLVALSDGCLNVLLQVVRADSILDSLCSLSQYGPYKLPRLPVYLHEMCKTLYCRRKLTIQLISHCQLTLNPAIWKYKYISFPLTCY